MRRMLVLDPGLDLTGWALFEIPEEYGARGVPTQTRAAQCFRRCGSYRTKPGQRLAARLAALHLAVTAQVVGEQISVVVLERPQIAGVYARHRQRAGTPDGFIPGTMMLNHQAAGVLAAAVELAGCRLVEEPAGRIPKDDRAQLLAWLLPHLTRTNGDERDAIYLGLRVLTDARRRWADGARSPAGRLG